MAVKTVVPKKRSNTIDTSQDDLKLHSLMVLSGKRGGGKSVSVSSWLLDCKRKSYFDRALLLTPTYMSNREIWDVCGIDPSDVFEPEKGVLSRILDVVQSERDHWDRFVERLKLWKEYQKATAKDIARCADDTGEMNERPTWKYKHREHMPRLCLILDDVMSLPVMMNSSEGLTNLCIRHRASELCSRG
eukprot:3230780-Pleurochrysis_carterae.AAC.1